MVDLAESMSTQIHHYVPHLMNVWFSAELSSVTSPVSSLLNENEGGKFVMSGFIHILLDIHHHWNSMQRLKDEGHYCIDDYPG